jgi:non-ribosomal peptide synthetase component F
LPALFAAQAVRTPDAVAVVFEDRTLSYAALDAHANRLAHHLQSLGVGPETMVGLCVERSPEMVIGLLGILKAGGAYLPLDPNYPRERLAFMLADAGCPVLVTQSALLDRLPEDAAHRQIVRLDADASVDRAAARHRAAARSRSASLGLRHLHLGLYRHTKGRRRRASADCCIECCARGVLHGCARAAVPASFVHRFRQFCCRNVLESFERRHTRVVVRLVGRRRSLRHRCHDVNCFLAVPSLYGALIDSIQDLPRVELQAVIVAGEACPSELVDRHHRCFPRVALVNEYGPTECSVWSSAHRLTQMMQAKEIFQSAVLCPIIGPTFGRWS